MSLDQQIKETVELAKRIGSARFSAFGMETKAELEAEALISGRRCQVQGHWLLENGTHEKGKWTADSVKRMTEAFKGHVWE